MRDIVRRWIVGDIATWLLLIQDLSEQWQSVQRFQTLLQSQPFFRGRPPQCEYGHQRLDHCISTILSRWNTYAALYVMKNDSICVSSGIPSWKWWPSYVSQGHKGCYRTKVKRITHSLLNGNLMLISILHSIFQHHWGVVWLSIRKPLQGFLQKWQAVWKDTAGSTEAE